MSINTLVVDDSQSALALMSALLDTLGISPCQCANSGDEALTLIRTAGSPIELIFVDLNMPGMDGMELVRRLSKEGFSGAIVILSELDNKIIQLASDVLLERCTRLVGCINKPVTNDKLSAMLNKYQLMNQQLKQHNKNALSIEQISAAITENRVIPYYQPKVDNKTGNVDSLEILVRISLPNELDAVSAVRFIDTAERHGLIEALTLSILQKVMHDLPAIFEEFGDDCQLSLNISALMLNNDKLPIKLLALLDEHGFSAKNFIIEVTESYAVDNTAQMETLNRLRINGFGLSLDDYGTGYTNIQQLKKLPYTEIKIDRSLIYNIANDKLSQVVAQALFDIFEELQVDVVTEGVELASDLHYLNSLDIPLKLQGFIISKPKMVDSICHWHRSWKRIQPQQSCVKQLEFDGFLVEAS